MSVKQILAAAVVSGATVFGGAVSAATFGGDFYGFFDNVSGADPDVFRYGNTNPPGPGNAGFRGLAWGYDNPNDNDFSDTSQLFINDTTFGCALGAGITSCDVGTISYYNASSNGPTNDEDFNARMRLYVDISDPTDLSRDADFVNINLRSSVNTVDPNSDPANNDFILATDWEQFFSVNLDLGNGFTLLGYDLSVDSGSLDFPSSTSFDWINSEENTSLLTITARIQGPAPVPLPAAGWMLIAGLGGMAAMKRRKKKS